MLRRPFEPGQYSSIAFTTRLLDAGVDASVGLVGDAYNNAPAETTIGLYKTELIRRHGPWRTVIRSNWPPSNTSTGTTSAGRTAPPRTYLPPADFGVFRGSPWLYFHP